ncbi:MAG: hypothetical protein ACXVLQ_08905 [Bacteriovorax sp.]
MKYLKYPTFLFGLLFCCFPFETKAYDAALSLGNLCEYVGKIQTNDSGSTNVCTFTPYLSGSVDFPLTPLFALSPEAGFSFPKSGRDENISKMNLFILANTKYKFSPFHVLGGLGFFFTRISGKGGNEELNNGTSTSSFPLPDSTIYSRNFILNLGLGASFDSHWSADLHTYVFNLLESEDRAFSIVINGTYHFGEF